MRVLPLILLLLVVGCGGVSSSPSSMSTSKTRIERGAKVGVVSALGDILYGTQIGTTIFSNEGFDANVGDWMIDDHTRDVAYKYLRERADVTPVRIGYDTDELFMKYFDDGSYYIDKLKGDMARLAQENRVDYIILIAGLNPEGDASEHRGAYGIFRRLHKLLALDDRTYTYTMFQLAIYNAKTGELTTEAESLPNLRSPGGLRWRSNYFEYKDREIERIEDDIKTEFEKIIPKVMRAMPSIPHARKDK